MNVDIQTEHHWLEKLTGDWEIIPDMSLPDEQRADGWIERGRMLHGVWLIVEGHGPMPGGGEATTLMTLGFDRAKGRFVGSWVGSMMDHMWVYDGHWNEAHKSLSLDCEGPDWENPGQTLKYRDIYTLNDDNTRTLTAMVQTVDGEWKRLMQNHYRRVNS
ncbi:MAG: hypothetical protein B7Z26_01370 [Asticcacaulis sp. 32-58-5]|nr:MAG: hypothetical protein B7Z26_01370 [Asticcacaulis sp. 32-58-5]